MFEQKSLATPKLSDQINIIHWPLRIKLLGLFLTIIGIIFYSFLVSKGLRNFNGVFDKQGNILGSDFINIWSAARIVLDNNVTELFDVRTYHAAQESLLNHTVLQTYNWSYPPLLLPWITWLGYFSYPTALTLWLAITFGLYALAVTYKQTNPLWLMTVLALGPASLENISHGQNGFLSAAFLVGGLRLLDKRPPLAGVLFGCMIYKPQLAALVPVILIATWRWRTLTAALLTVLILVLISILLYGVEPWELYFGKTLPYQKSILEISPLMQKGFTRMMPTIFTAARILGASQQVAHSLNILLALGVAFMVIRVFRRAVPTHTKIALFLTATFLVTPYAFSYDMPILSAGLMMWVMASRSRINIIPLLFGSFMWLLPPLVIYFNVYNYPLAPLFIILLLFMQFSGLEKGNPIAATGNASNARS
jgi:hypothetical protein